MKKRVVKGLISTLYVYGWYVPLFLLLLAVKICLLSMISNSIRNQQEQRFLSRSRKHVEKYGGAGIRERAAVSPTTIKTDLSDLIPENLEELEITPTGENRTSPTSIWLIYNSVPKCDEEQIVNLLETLSSSNRFSHQQHEYQTPWPRFLLAQEQDSLVQWFQYQHLPKSYSRHFFYVNFKKFQKYFHEKPIYFNVVRDPVYRLALDYYSRRNKSSSVTKQEIRMRNSAKPGSGTEWYQRTFEECVLQADPECRYTAGEKSFTLMTPFFCGQHNSCVIINDRWALQMAKLNIEREYSVVGVLEKMNESLKSLEKFAPRFFSGAGETWDKQRKKQPSHPHFSISSYVRQIIETELYNEVELYQFINRRLEIQLKS